jgi:hypothetical protein
MVLWMLILQKSEKWRLRIVYFLMSILVKEVTAHLTALDSFPRLCPLSLCVNSFPRDLCLNY